MLFDILNKLSVCEGMYSSYIWFYHQKEAAPLLLTVSSGPPPLGQLS